MRPHSFILVDQPPELPPAVPDHLLEAEPDLAWVTCPACDGAGWVVSAQPNTWTGGDAYCPCLRCRQRGEVLEVVELEPEDSWHLAAAA